VLRHIVWPATRNPFWIAVVVVMALSLGELAASKIVQVPNRPTFVQELFSQMHYGATATTAALALVLLVPASLAFLGLYCLQRPNSPKSSRKAR
jgi:ABC-type Fe3+ transport system permease subunit